MNRIGLFASVFITTALGAGVFACASTTPTTGDETHFVACKVNGDCTSGQQCESGYCQKTSKDGGGGGASTGSGGSGSGGEAESGGSSGTGAGNGGSGGSTLSPLCEAIANSSGDLDASTVRELAGDAASACVLDVANYDQSCTKDADCTMIGVGDSCGLPCEVACPSAAINARDLSRYQADRARSPTSACPPEFCGCPAIGSEYCVAGKCELLLCGANSDGSDAGCTVRPRN